LLAKYCIEPFHLRRIFNGADMDWLQFIPVFIVAALGGVVLFALFHQRIG
jgi:hypothetical protein